MAKGKPGRPTKVAGTRKWFRSIVENPELRAEVENVIRAGVANGDLTDYWKAVEHGFGRPPQALDVKVAGDKESPIYCVQTSDGYAMPPEDAGLPATGTGFEGTG